MNTDVLLFAGGVFIVIVGLRLLNKDAGGTIGGIALIMGGLGAVIKACGFGWTATVPLVNWWPR